MKPVRIIVALVLAFAGWRIYDAYYSPEGRARAASLAAVQACRAIGLDENLSVAALHERHQHCDSMEEAHREKWGK